MSKLIDAKGKNCPIPVILAKKEIAVRHLSSTSKSEPV